MHFLMVFKVLLERIVRYTNGHVAIPMYATETDVQVFHDDVKHSFDAIKAVAPSDARVEEAVGVSAGLLAMVLQIMCICRVTCLQR